MPTRIIPRPPRLSRRAYGIKVNLSTPAFGVSVTEPRGICGKNLSSIVKKLAPLLRVKRTYGSTISSVDTGVSSILPDESSRRVLKWSSTQGLSTSSTQYTTGPRASAMISWLVYGCGEIYRAFMGKFNSNDGLVFSQSGGSVK